MYQLVLSVAHFVEFVNSVYAKKCMICQINRYFTEVKANIKNQELDLDSCKSYNIRQVLRALAHDAMTIVLCILHWMMTPSCISLR